MARRGRPGLPDGVRQQVWLLWKQGRPASEIGRALGCKAAAVRGVLAAHGGIAPAVRIRHAAGLTLAEREEVSRGLAAGWSYREIARRLDRAPSTISREVDRNGGPRAYRAGRAEEQAWERARRPKASLLAQDAELRKLVAQRLALQWSPEQISAWLKLEFPDDETLRVSHETIYRSLFIQARGALKKELCAHLRSGRTMRRAKSATKASRGGIVDAVSIRERPAEVEDRAVPGHWEGDLISGSKNSHVATLVERHSRFVMLVKVNGKDTASVVSALSKQVQTLPEALRRSLTWDRGTEMAGHKDFTVATDVQVYFCDPKSPWQRGSNENTNGLLRQYLPDGTDLSVHSQAQLDEIALRLNQRPRKTLGFRTPAYKLGECVATTA